LGRRHGLKRGLKPADLSFLRECSSLELIA
jgi:hypothetical protein